MPGLERMMAQAQIDHQTCYRFCGNWNGTAQEMFSSEDLRKALPLLQERPMGPCDTLHTTSEYSHTPQPHPDPETARITSVAPKPPSPAP